MDKLSKVKVSKAADRDTQGLIDALINVNVQSSQGYKVADARGMLKLDAMENPFGLSPEHSESLLTVLANLPINRYPDASCHSLVTALKRYWSIPTTYELLLGNGSDELIQLLIIALSHAGEQLKVMSVEPSFVMYSVLAKHLNADFIGVKLKPNWDLDSDSMLSAIQTHQPGLIFLAQPNNPTGNLFGLESLQAVLEASTGLVVIDEAYGAFSEREHLSLLSQFNNLLIMRTLSKVGYAGLRLGALVGLPEWIAELDKVRLPYNINIASQVIAEYVVQQPDMIHSQVLYLKAEREKLIDALNDNIHFEAFASQANFFLLRPLRGSAKALFEYLKTQKILVKCLDGSHPLLHNFLRITVGTKKENERLVSQLYAYF